MRPQRLDVSLPRLALGEHTLTAVHLTGTALGRPLGTAPTFLLLGGITASDTPLGEGGWWPALGGPGRCDPDHHTILAFALPGKGSRFEALDDPGADLPELGAAELADLVEAWLVAIEAPEPLRVIGASIGGLVGLALAARHPRRVARLATISAGTRPDGWGTGLRHLQRQVVRQAVAAGDPREGMRLARQLGMLTYRGREEIETRFRPVPGEVVPPIASYLDHHGDRFADAFDPRAFLLLSGAIDRPALGHDRETVQHALARVRAPTVVVGVPQDLLFPFRLQKELYEDLRAAGVPAALRTLDSPTGHDAFLTEQDALARILDEEGLFAPEPEPEGRDAEPTTTAVRTVRLGLVGAGTVGGALLELLAARREDLAERHGLRFEVVGLAVRDTVRDRGPWAQGIPRHTDALALATDPLVDVVVEVAGGVAAMQPVLEAALAAGKPVVTANKALLAQALGPLVQRAAEGGVALGFEAAAAAALPVLRSLARQVDGVRRVAGIVNGTSNFVLTRLEEGVSLEDAVADAQQRGFAEADPSADLDGHDAAAKLTLLAYRAFGAWIRPDAFEVEGIRTLRPVDLELARRLGHRVRHLAWVARDPAGLRLGVGPMILPAWHLLAGVEEEYNAVYLDGAFAGDLAFFGRGAGGAPTASAVISDLVDVAGGSPTPCPPPRALPVAPAGEQPRRHLVLVDGTEEGLERVSEALRRDGLSVRASTSQPGPEEGIIHGAWVLDPTPPDRVRALLGRLDARPDLTRCLSLGGLQ